MLEVASELQLTDDQQQKLKALIADFAQDAARAAGDRPTKEFTERRRKLREEYATKAVEEVLTAEQKATLDKRSNNQKPQQLPHSVLDQIVPDAEPKPAKPEKNPAAVALGRLGGLKGGKARAAQLSPAKRKAIAKKTAATRWNRTG